MPDGYFQRFIVGIATADDRDADQQHDCDEPKSIGAGKESQRNYVLLTVQRAKSKQLKGEHPIQRRLLFEMSEP